MHVARCEGARTPPTFALCSLRLNTFSKALCDCEFQVVNQFNALEWL